MTATAWAVAPLLGFLLPARSSRLDVFRILTAGTGLAALFLFTARYYVPGGASDFVLWAQALADGSTLPPATAQRDIGFPLLLLLSGYTVTGSFIGITLIHTAFAVLMPVLIYVAIRPFSASVAYFSGQLSNICLGSFIFIKVIHHDQAYIFFTILSIVWLIVFFHTQAYKYLYLFTGACIAASVSRPAGNLLFPLFLLLAFVAASPPRKFSNFVACAAIFAASMAAYQWHRYEIFDMRSQPSVPSYVGAQVFYNLYMNSGEFGITLSPDIGPNMRLMDSALRAKLAPTPQESPFLKAHIDATRQAFADSQLLAFSLDELMRRIYLVPNWEYYLLLCNAEPNDQTILKAAGEIVREHPFYVLQYSIRNLMVFLFHPGYAHTRYNIFPFQSIGLDFYPVSGRVFDTVYMSPRSIREAQLDVLPFARWSVKVLFFKINFLWDKLYQTFVETTSTLILVAWLALGWSGACALTRRLRGSAACVPLALWSQGNFLPAVLAASVLLLYNAAVTAVFAEPDYRYHDFMLLPRVLLAGFGLIVLVRLVAGEIGQKRPSAAVLYGAGGLADRMRRWIDTARGYDFVEIHIGARPWLGTSILVLVTAVLYVAWARFMCVHAG